MTTKAETEQARIASGTTEELAAGGLIQRTDESTQAVEAAIAAAAAEAMEWLAREATMAVELILE